MPGIDKKRTPIVYLTEAAADEGGDWEDDRRLGRGDNGGGGMDAD